MYFFLVVGLLLKKTVFVMITEILDKSGLTVTKAWEA